MAFMSRLPFWAPGLLFFMLHSTWLPGHTQPSPSLGNWIPDRPAEFSQPDSWDDVGSLPRDQMLPRSQELTKTLDRRLPPEMSSVSSPPFSSAQQDLYLGSKPKFKATGLHPSEAKLESSDDVRSLPREQLWPRPQVFTETLDRLLPPELSAVSPHFGAPHQELYQKVFIRNKQKAKSLQAPGHLSYETPMPPLRRPNLKHAEFSNAPVNGGKYRDQHMPKEYPGLILGTLQKIYRKLIGKQDQADSEQSDNVLVRGKREVETPDVNKDEDLGSSERSMLPSKPAEFALSPSENGKDLAWPPTKEPLGPSARPGKIFKTKSEHLGQHSRLPKVPIKPMVAHSATKRDALIPPPDPSTVVASSLVRQEDPLQPLGPDTPDYSQLPLVGQKDLSQLTSYSKEDETSPSWQEDPAQPLDLFKDVERSIPLDDAAQLPDRIKEPEPSTTLLEDPDLPSELPEDVSSHLQESLVPPPNSPTEAVSPPAAGYQEVSTSKGSTLVQPFPGQQGTISQSQEPLDEVEPPPSQQENTSQPPDSTEGEPIISQQETPSQSAEYPTEEEPFPVQQKDSPQPPEFTEEAESSVPTVEETSPGQVLEIGPSMQQENPTELADSTEVVQLPSGQQEASAQRPEPPEDKETPSYIHETPTETLEPSKERATQYHEGAVLPIGHSEGHHPTQSRATSAHPDLLLTTTSQSITEAGSSPSQLEASPPTPEPPKEAEPSPAHTGGAIQSPEHSMQMAPFPTKQEVTFQRPEHSTQTEPFPAQPPEPPKEVEFPPILLRVPIQCPEQPGQVEPSPTQQEVLSQPPEPPTESEPCPVQPEAPSQTLEPLKDEISSVQQGGTIQSPEPHVEVQPSTTQQEVPFQFLEPPMDIVPSSAPLEGPSQAPEPPKEVEPSLAEQELPIQSAEPPAQMEPSPAPQEILSQPPEEVQPPSVQPEALVPPQESLENEPSALQREVPVAPSEPPKEMECSPLPEEAPALPLELTENVQPLPVQQVTSAPSAEAPEEVGPLLSFELIPLQTLEELSITPSTTPQRPTIPSSNFPEVTIPHQAQPPNWNDVTKHADIEFTISPDLTAEGEPVPTHHKTPAQTPEPLKGVVPEYPTRAEMRIPLQSQEKLQNDNLPSVTVQLSNSELPLSPEIQVEVESSSIKQEPSTQPLEPPHEGVTRFPVPNNDICELCICKGETLTCTGFPPEKILQILSKPTSHNCIFRTLNLHGNEISSINENIWKDYPWIETLNLSSNLLTELYKESFKGLLSLRYLHLWYLGSQTLQMQFGETPNDITTPWSRPFITYSWNTLDLSGNKIKYIERGTFEAVPFLEVVNLGCNLINEISFGTFQAWHGMPFLHKVILHNNPLPTFNDPYLSALSEVRYLDLGATLVSLTSVENILTMTGQLHKLILPSRLACCLCRFKSIIEVVCGTVKVQCNSECLSTITTCTEAEEASLLATNGKFFKLLQAWKTTTRAQLTIVPEKPSPDRSHVVLKGRRDLGDKNYVLKTLHQPLPYLSDAGASIEQKMPSLKTSFLKARERNKALPDLQSHTEARSFHFKPAFKDENYQNKQKKGYLREHLGNDKTEEKIKAADNAVEASEQPNNHPNTGFAPKGSASESKSASLLLSPPLSSGDKMLTQLQHQLLPLFFNREVGKLMAQVILLVKDCNKTQVHLTFANLIARTGLLLKHWSQQVSKKEQLEKARDIIEIQETKELRKPAQDRKLTVPLCVAGTVIMFMIAFFIYQVWAHFSAGPQKDLGKTSQRCFLCFCPTKKIQDESQRDGFQTGWPLWVREMRKSQSQTKNQGNSSDEEAVYNKKEEMAKQRLQSIQVKMEESDESTE